MVGWNGLGERVEDELRGGGPIVWGLGSRAGPGGQTAEQARHVMEAAAAVEAGGAVFLLSWYFLVLVCARHWDTGEEADAVCLLRTRDQTKCKWTYQPVPSRRGSAAPAGGRCVCKGSEVGRRVERVRAGSVVGGPGGPRRLRSVLGLRAGGPTAAFYRGEPPRPAQRMGGLARKGCATCRSR